MFSRSLNLSSLGDKNEQDLANPSKLREIGAQVVKSISDAIGTIYNKDNVADKGDIFKNVFLENGTKTVAQKIADMTDDTEMTPKSRKELGNILMAQAMLGNKDIVIKPIGKSMEDATKLSADFKDFAPKKISIIDRILGFLGFKSEEIIKENKVKAIGKYAKKSAKTELENDAKIRQKNKETIENSTMLAEVKRPVYDKVKKEIDADRDKLTCLYLNGIGETECANLEDANKRLDALPSGYRFSKRSWLQICTCVMLRDGHSMKDIYDPNYMPKYRADVGREVAAIAAGMASEDSNTKTQASSKLVDLYLEGGKKLLEQPMPSEDELLNFTDSKSKAAIYAIPYMAFDLTQELENLKLLVLNNPRDRALFANINQVAGLGLLGMTFKYRACDFHKVSDDEINTYDAKKDVRKNVIAMESCINVAKEMKFDYSGTVGEALKKNADKLTKFQGFSAVLSGEFSKEVVPTKVKVDPLPLEKIMNGEESVLKRAESTKNFKYHYPVIVEMYGREGSVKTVYERAELANNIADKLEKVSEESYSKEVKDKLASSIFYDPKFNELTDINAETTTSYINDQKFFTDYIKGFDTAAKLKDAQTQAKVLSEKRKEINLSEDELKKIDVKKAEKAKGAINK